MNVSEPKKKQSGQMTVEMVLILLVLVGLFQFALTKFDNFKPLAQFAGEPWQVISGMMEFGIWENPANISLDKHPTHWKRIFNMEGDSPP